MNTPRQLILLVLSGATVLSLAGIASAAPRFDGPNLLQNPGFESPFAKQCCHTDVTGGQPGTLIDEVQVAEGWRGWWLEPGQDPYHPAACETPGCTIWHRPEWREANCGDVCANRIRSGGNAQKYFTFFSVHDAGMLQQVSGIRPGARLRFSAYMQAWSTHAAYGESSGQNSMGMRVGIDPAGGTDAFSPNVVWSPVMDVYDAWGLYVVEAVARSSTVTVFTRSAPVWPLQHNDVYVDDASLVVVSGAPPASAATPTGLASTPPAASTPTPVAGVAYVVQRGDNFYRIARRFGVTARDIIVANRITNPNILYVGQTLIIPGVTSGGAPAATPPPAPAGATIYIVQRGDFLLRLARRFGTTVARIKELNGLTSDIIYVGQRLIIAP